MKEGAQTEGKLPPEKKTECHEETTQIMKHDKDAANVKKTIFAASNGNMWRRSEVNLTIAGSDKFKLMNF